MSPEACKFLQYNPVSLIRNVGGAPYITENLESHVFYSIEQANEFRKSIGESIADELRTWTPRNLSMVCFLNGATQIILHLPGGEKKEAIDPPKKEEVYSNVPLNRALSLLKETGKDEYAKRIGRMKYLVPVIIDSPLKYTYGIIKSGEDSYLAVFSDMDEFRRCEEISLQYSPLSLIFEDMIKIVKKCGTKGMLLNPKGNTLYLPIEMLEEIKCSSQNG